VQLAFELFGVVAKNAFLVEDWLHPHGIKNRWVDLAFLRTPNERRNG